LCSLSAILKKQPIKLLTNFESRISTILIHLNMRLFLLFTAVILSSCLLTGCKNNPDKNIPVVNSETGNSIADGEQKEFYPNGNIHYIVEYQNGKANGRVREYTSDGKIYMDAVFKDGHRHGKCTHFYKNGKPFEVANYVNGEKDGIESKFYDNGKLLATRIYKKNKIQPGLKEYKADGTKVNNENTLIVQGIDHTALEGKYIIKVSLSKPQPKAVYFAAPKNEPGARQELKKSGEAGILEIPVSSKSFVMKVLLFQAEYKTRLGNTVCLEKSFNLAIDR
jgi:hypothetical protein